MSTDKLIREKIDSKVMSYGKIMNLIAATADFHETVAILTGIVMNIVVVAVAAASVDLNATAIGAIVIRWGRAAQEGVVGNLVVRVEHPDTDGAKVVVAAGSVDDEMKVMDVAIGDQVVLAIDPDTDTHISCFNVTNNIMVSTVGDRDAMPEGIVNEDAFEDDPVCSDVDGPRPIVVVARVADGGSITFAVDGEGDRISLGTRVVDEETSRPRGAPLEQDCVAWK